MTQSDDSSDQILRYADSAIAGLLVLIVLESARVANTGDPVGMFTGTVGTAILMAHCKAGIVSAGFQRGGEARAA